MTTLSRPNGNRIGRAVLALMLACTISFLAACANASSSSAAGDAATASTSAAQSTSSEQSSSTAQATDTKSAATFESGVSGIEKGNVTLTLTAHELLESFARGDILTLAFDGQTIDVPVVSSYSDVDSGASSLVVREDKDLLRLVTSMGDFAATYGITDKTTFVISLKEAGGYLEDLKMRDLSYTDERSDYPNLTDAQFANFRVVSTTGMDEGVLYRGATPIDPKHKRNTFADACLKDAGVKTILNLSNTEDEAAAFPGYADTYYASVSHVALGMSYDFASADFQEKLVSGLRYLIDNEGPYYIHCLEGKDRTGFVVAMLECLMGASYDEVVADYMVTFDNYYGVKAGDPRYDYCAQHGIELSLKRAFGVEDLASVDLAAKAEEFLKSIGMTQDEIAALKTKLAAAASAAAAPAAA